MESPKNLTLIKRDENLKYHINPSYLSYKHVNPIMFALNNMLELNEVDEVVNGYRRSTFTEEALIADYMRGNVPKHDYTALAKVRVV